MTFIAGVLRRAGDASAVVADMLAGDLFPASSLRFLSSSAALALGVSLTNDLPEDCFDSQPLRSGPHTLICDIRIDNRAELAAALDFPAPEAARMADSALFLAAWTRWQKDCVDHFTGAFAVAIWDSSRQELCLVRDHCGERPLYYLHDAGTFAFASMPSALRRIRDVDTSLDQDSLLHYVATGPDSSIPTYFRNIQLLRPGHLLTLKQGEAAVKRYWHPMDGAPIRLGSDAAYVEALVERFDAAVRARLRTTGKIGSQLSGGMDSSSVTATAAHMLGTTELTAFTAVPQADFSNVTLVGRFGNEAAAAAKVAAMYPNVKHVLIEPSGLDLLKVVEQTGRLTDSPVYNPLNQMWVNAILDESRARGIKVVLQAPCGNATISFGGLIGLSDLFRHGRWIQLIRQVMALRSKGHTSWRGAAYWAAGGSLPMGLRKLISPELRAFDFSFSPVHPDRAREHHLREKAFLSFFGEDKDPQAYRRRLFDYYDTGFANAGASLGWGISLRDATQDKRLFEFCLSIPIEQYLVGGQSRSLVRRSMRDRLPPEILNCTTRGLQAADWYLTMGNRRKQMREELECIRTSPMARYLLDLDRLQMLLDTWPDSGFETARVYDSWHLALSRGLAVGNFIRNFEATR